MFRMKTKTWYKQWTVLSSSLLMSLIIMPVMNREAATSRAK